MVLDIDLKALATFVFVTPLVYAASKVRYIAYDAPIATWYWLTGKQIERITQPEGQPLMEQAQ